MHLFKRLYLYQAERFPVLGHGLLIAAFTFSAAAYSRICRGAADFIPLEVFLPGVFMTVGLFFLLRLFDEHKDAEDDARFRPELPVPRGLVTLAELRRVGWVVFGMQCVVLWWKLPPMIPIFFGVMAYMLLMGKEFFVPAWLKRHQLWYVTSHMFIIPLVDVFASGLDWRMEGYAPPLGLVFFFAVSYFNGLVLEIGRKIKAPEQESDGVLSYTAQLGTKRAVGLWCVLLTCTLLLAIAAAAYAGFGLATFGFLSAIFLLCISMALRFLQHYSAQRAKAIEIASGLWTLSMYLSLGGVPMLRALWH